MWLRYARNKFKKIGPFSHADAAGRSMECDVLRLAETSTHLLRDIGFDAQSPAPHPQTTRWRAQQMPDVTLVETQATSFWDYVPAGRG